MSSESERTDRGNDQQGPVLLPVLTRQCTSSEQAGRTVASIIPDQKDFTGLDVVTVYSKVSEIFAVYSNTERLMVQYADDPKLGAEQRLALAQLAPLRGEINGLIDGWRSSKNPFYKSKARRYDRRTADALMVALQGDQENAATLLKMTKQDLFDERSSIGRYQYMLTAVICAVAAFLIFGILATFEGKLKAVGVDIPVGAYNVWMLTGFGCLGALFSIALGIRSRDINTDLQVRSNIVDASLRILIGLVSAVVVLSILKSNLLSLTLNGTAIKMDTTLAAGMQMHAAIVFAFLAGFSERLLGSFLSTAVLGIPGTKTERPVPQPASAATKIAHEENPLGKQNPV